ncbi:hypothetical protein MTBSS4_10246 [Magnetospirillum sp. SS-4]|nr:hypothetical protein MTBSS4_10246 [Magnetospirillum sp. SS-4]
MPWPIGAAGVRGDKRRPHPSGPGVALQGGDEGDAQGANPGILGLDCGEIMGDMWETLFPHVEVRGSFLPLHPPLKGGIVSRGGSGDMGKARGRSVVACPADRPGRGFAPAITSIERISPCLKPIASMSPSAPRSGFRPCRCPPSRPSNWSACCGTRPRARNRPSSI